MIKNINRIDFDLKNLFEKVDIVEKTNRSNFYFEINASQKILLDGIKKSPFVKVEINKNDLNYDLVKWNYYIDPKNENSEKIERISKIENVASDIYKLISEKRMLASYFESLDTNIDPLNEGDSSISIKTTKQNIEEILSKYVKVSKITENEEILLEDDKFADRKPDIRAKFEHTSNIKISDKFKIESEINKLDGVNFTAFSDNQVIVDYSK